MNPSPALIDFIRERQPGWHLSDLEIAETLNALTTLNPVAEAPQVRVRPTLAQLLACITDDGRRAQVVQWSLFPRLFDAYQAGDLETLRDLSAAALAAGFVGEAEIGAMGQLFAATQPDPEWQKELPLPLVEFGRPVDEEDVAAARAAMGEAEVTP